MAERESNRPSLRLIAGELVNNLAHDVVEIAEVALTGKMPQEPPTESQGPTARPDGGRKPRIAVIGGGIAGLAAAWSLVNDRKVEADVTIFESSGEVGGKLALTEVEGITLDAGAESLLAVRPEAVALAKAVGLSSSIVHPTTTSANVVSRGSLHPLPTGLMSGIPTDMKSLAASDIISVPGLLRIPLDYVLPKTALTGDVSIGDFVTTRVGREVVERLVEPMLGGVYAGWADDLSLEMTVPALYRLAKNERSLLVAATEARATGASPTGARRGGAVFAGISGGVGRLPLALADRLAHRGVTIEVDSPVSALRKTASGWRVSVRIDGRSHPRDFDAVVLATPAPISAKLLRKANPGASELLDTVKYASVALTTLLYDPQDVPTSLSGSGFLVPPVEGYSIKAATYSSRKWSWVARAGASAKDSKGHKRSVVIVRASLGRFNEPEILNHTDAELAAVAAKDLYKICGLGPKPIASAVTRWDDSLPQYTVGHRGRITNVREELVSTPGVTVCGAAYDGVGIPACIGSAQFAAGQIVSYLDEQGRLAHG